MAIKSKAKGKRSGSRVVNHVVTIDEVVFMLTVFDKSEQASINDAELNELLNKIES